MRYRPTWSPKPLSTSEATMPLRQRTRTTSRTGRPRRTMLVVASVAVPLVLVGGAGVVLAATAPPAVAPDPAAAPAAPADPNPNCSLIVPADPLSAKGLATPYQLVATDRRQGACHESNDAQAAKDGLPCPTVRDFAVVDQDQSDNVVSSYLILGTGRTAQDTADNRTRFGNRATRMTNGSDNGLVDRVADPALGCTAWTAPDLGDAGANS